MGEDQEREKQSSLKLNNYMTTYWLYIGLNVTHYNFIVIVHRSL